MMKKIFSLMCLVVLFFPLASRGEMKSDNYTIFADSIGMDGGAYSTSTNYSLFDSTAESPSGLSTSTSYEIRGGYQAMDRNDLSIDISNTSLNLGSVMDNAVATANTNISVTSFSSTGYTLSIGSILGTMPAWGVTGGAVTAGTTGYGFSASGSNSLIAGDVAVAAGTSIASSAVPARNTATTLTFKAARATDTPVSGYNHTITFTVSANF